jgi:ferritin-like metal-binding protein YciE
MPDKDKTLDDLFLDTLKDIYYAEKQILNALPKMAKAATSDELRAAFEKHEAKLRSRSSASSRYLNFSASHPAARPVMPSWASLKRAKR